MHRLLISFIAVALVLCSCAQTPMVYYKSSAHYHKRVEEFHHLPMITSDNIVMLGNSLTEFGGDWNERIPDADGLIINRGIKGDDALGMINRLQQITPGQPKKIFVGCGINDVSHKLSNEQVVRDVCRLLEEIKKQTPHSEIYYFSLLPINEDFHRWRNLEGRTDDIPLINNMMQEWCRTNGITFIDVFSAMTAPDSNVLRSELSIDGLHLSEKGYAVWVLSLIHI